MMRMRFPRSRISSNGQCKECRLFPGDLVDRGRVRWTDNEGREVEMMLWTCNKCGHTMLFDLDVPRTRPWDEDSGRVEEEPID